MFSSSTFSWSWQQHKMQPCSEGIPISDRGFRYGKHLFETIAIRDGRPLFAEEHLRRFLQAAERFHFPLETSSHDGLRDFLKRNFPSENGMLRLFITAGDGAPTSPIKAPRLFSFFEKATFPSQQSIAQGASVISLTHPIGNTYWGIKNGNYWEHLCALEDAEKAGANEGLIFNADDCLISASMATVFVWLDDVSEPITPPLSCGARDGVVRAWVQQQYPQIIEHSITRSDLTKIKAMVLTNSRIGVMPVVMLDGKRLPEFELALNLAKTYLKTFCCS